MSNKPNIKGDLIAILIAIIMVVCFFIMLKYNATLPEVRHSVSEDKCVAVKYVGDNKWDCTNLPKKYSLVHVK